MLEDLGHPPPGAIARALGVSARTVARWRASGEAPRAVLLALFWLTRWGSSALDCELHNRAQVYRSLSESRGRQVMALKRRIEALEAVAHTGAANADYFDPLDPEPPRLRTSGRRPTAF
jgi:hypothetical protein